MILNNFERGHVRQSVSRSAYKERVSRTSLQYKEPQEASKVIMSSIRLQYPPVQTEVPVMKLVLQRGCNSPRCQGS